VLTWFRISLIALLAMLMAGCAARIESNVARFHQLSPPKGETVAIVPLDQTKQGSLEFATYARQVADALATQGFRIAEPGQPADIVARLDYGVSDGSVQVATRPGFSGFGRPYWGSRWSRWGWYDPWGPFGFNDYPDVYSYTTFSRRLELTMTRANEPKALFEGRVESIGRDNRLPEVMPYLIRALFKDFPGQSGVTVKVIEEIPARS
jgi:hypothetical protein